MQSTRKGNASPAAETRAANHSSRTQQASNPAPDPAAAPCLGLPLPARPLCPRCSPRRPRGPPLPGRPLTRRGPRGTAAAGQDRPSAEPGPRGGGDRRLWRAPEVSAVPSPAGRRGRQQGCRCPREGRTHPPGGRERRGGAGQRGRQSRAYLRGWRGGSAQRRAAAAGGSERGSASFPLGAAPDGAPPPAPPGARRAAGSCRLPPAPSPSGRSPVQPC